MIGCFRKFFGRMPNAVRFGNVDLQKRDLAVVFFHTFASKFVGCCLAGLFIARAEENTKTFARQLPRDFKPDPFVRAGNERDSFCSCHGEILPRKAGTLKINFSRWTAPDTDAYKTCDLAYQQFSFDGS